MNKYGGPAFPSQAHDNVPAQNGMTLRDYAAIAAMPAYIADALSNDGVVDCREVASFSYEVADAMLVEREK